MENIKKTLLLLSGGKDSKQTLGILLSRGYEVSALCMSGHENLKKQEQNFKDTLLNTSVIKQLVLMNTFCEIKKL